MAAALSHPTQQPAPAGYPASLFHLTSADAAYWREPGLSWLQDVRLSLNTVEITSHCMAPRFPKHCQVATALVTDRQNLRLGRVYVYTTQSECGESIMQIGRLVNIGGDAVQATTDNDPVLMQWNLAKGQLQEVTHYISLPEEDEETAGIGFSSPVTQCSTLADDKQEEGGLYIPAELMAICSIVGIGPLLVMAEILRLHRLTEEVNVADEHFVERFHIGPDLVKRHIRKLVEAGLIREDTKQERIPERIITPLLQGLN